MVDIKIKNILNNFLKSTDFETLEKLRTAGYDDFKLYEEKIKSDNLTQSQLKEINKQTKLIEQFKTPFKSSIKLYAGALVLGGWLLSVILCGCLYSINNRNSNYNPY